jgi:DNA gyrase subunit B
MNNKETTFRFNDGIGELLSMYVGDKQSLHPLIRFQKQIEQSVIIENKEEIDKVIIDLALQYTIEDNENCQIDFLNGSNLVNHGTINDGMSWGLRTAFNKFIKDNGMYKKNESEINWQDAEYGLNYVCNVKSFFPIYANQTKLSTDVGYYKTLVRKMVEEYFEIFSLQNKEIMMKLAQKVLANKHIREITEQSRSKAKKKLDEKLTVMTKPEKYVDCRSKDKNVRELYLVEGDSALGSCKQGRDKNIQALFPVKGKILNCLKQADEKIFNNDIILDLIKIFGCGVEKRSKFTKDLPRFDEDNIQWDKIIIMSDQDDDGFQIRTLVLTAIYVICPSLIKLGKVYVVDSPLHIIESGGKTYFAYSDKEKFDILSKLKGSFKTSRSKGLGENDADMLWQTSMNPQTRKLTKITVDDIVLMNETFELFLGDNLDGRKEYIEQYGDNYVDFSVFGL